VLLKGERGGRRREEEEVNMVGEREGWKGLFSYY